MVYIYKLDRLECSLRHLLTVVGDLQQLGVGLASLTDAINTTSAQGRFVFNLFASLAESKLELIRERAPTSGWPRPVPGVGWASAGWASQRRPNARPSLPRRSTVSSNSASTRLPSAYTSPKLYLISAYATATSSSTRTVTRQLAKPPITFGPNF